MAECSCRAASISPVSAETFIFLIVKQCVFSSLAALLIKPPLHIAVWSTGNGRYIFVEILLRAASEWGNGVLHTILNACDIKCAFIVHRLLAVKAVTEAMAYLIMTPIERAIMARPLLTIWPYQAVYGEYRPAHLRSMMRQQSNIGASISLWRHQ